MQAVTPSGLPFSGSTPLSLHNSAKGADAARVRALPQLVRYLALLHQRWPDGLTDAEAADVMGLERTSINARRVPCVEAGLVESYGSRARESTGNSNTIWRWAR